MTAVQISPPFPTRRRITTNHLGTLLTKDSLTSHCFTSINSTPVIEPTVAHKEKAFPFLRLPSVMQAQTFPFFNIQETVLFSCVNKEFSVSLEGIKQNKINQKLNSYFINPDRNTTLEEIIEDIFDKDNHVYQFNLLIIRILKYQDIEFLKALIMHKVNIHNVEILIKILDKALQVGQTRIAEMILTIMKRKEVDKTQMHHLKYSLALAMSVNRQELINPILSILRSCPRSDTRWEDDFNRFTFSVDLKWPKEEGTIGITNGNFSLLCIAIQYKRPQIVEFILPNISFNHIKILIIQNFYNNPLEEQYICVQKEQRQFEEMSNTLNNPEEKHIFTRIEQRNFEDFSNCHNEIVNLIKDAINTIERAIALKNGVWNFLLKHFNQNITLQEARDIIHRSTDTQ